jgi:predicted AAA+ superfamily ATPase
MHLLGGQAPDYSGVPLLCNRRRAGAKPMTPQKESDSARLARMAEALERLAPPPVARAVPGAGDAFVWEPQAGGLMAVTSVASLPIGLLKGVDHARDTLFENTRRFADELPANNALLWGARGMGKSSLVKAVHAQVNRGRKERLVLVEIHREEIASLPVLLRLLRASPRRFLLFCDDLSFDKDDTSYKSLKAALEGGIEGRPANVLFYATSNRRHLMPRDMMENERSTAINPSEAVEEKVSLSDRFGLWLGFHNCGQDEYLAMIEGYTKHYGIKIPQDELKARAIAWAAGRGSRSGRVAWQFIQDLAGELGIRLDQ